MLHTQVLLSRDGTAKLGDLGMARLLADAYVQTAVVGTLAWCACLGCEPSSLAGGAASLCWLAGWLAGCLCTVRMRGLARAWVAR